jgi:DNA-binding response OmpR family regulator
MVVSMSNFSTTAGDSKPSFSSQSVNLSNESAQAVKPFVMVMGNDLDTRFLFRTAFEIWNYDVAEVDNLEQSLSIGKSKKADLVFMDAEIDVQKSFQALKTLQASPTFKKTGFIMVSGHAQDRVRRMALAAGANFYLVKPIDFGLLEQFLRNYFRNKESAVLSKMTQF